MKPATSPASPVTSKTDWDSLPLGEDRSYLCGGRNLQAFLDAPDDEGLGTPSPADEKRMAREWLEDPNIG
jgi:hypothetical protein